MILCIYVINTIKDILLAFRISLIMIINLYFQINRTVITINRYSAGEK